MKSFQIQSSFNNGVVDELLAARLDIKQYYQGLLQGTNIVCLPQGGISRRPGLKYIDEAAGTGRVVPFIFNTDQSYVLVLSNLKIEVFRADTEALVDTVVTTYAIADIPDLDFVQSADTMIIVHEDYAPRQLVRGATDADFTISTITFTNIPQFDYNDASSPADTSEIQTLTFSTFSSGDTYKLNLEGVDTDLLAWSSSISDMAEDVADALQNLANTPTSGISATGSGSVITVTFADASAKPWRIMSGRSVDVPNGSTNNTITTARTQTGVARTEDVWSATRGWPRTVTFFEGRLWFGGSAQRPNSLWGSRVNEYYDYDPGKSRADDSIHITMDTDQINRIQALYAGRSLQVFTVGGEHVFKTAVSEPITPENVAILPQTAYGSKRHKPVQVGGVTMFIQRTGTAIREFVYSDTEEAYDSLPITMLAPNIISDPVDISVQRGSSSTDATYVYATNDDGTLGVFNSARHENVAAWSKWSTEGEFISSTVVLDDLWCLVKRTIDSVDKYYLEKADSTYYLDSAKQYGATASLTSLDHLDAEVIRVVIDGYRVLPDETVPSSTPWTVTLPLTPTTSEVGLDFVPTLETMPAAQNPGAGFNLRKKMRITRATLTLVDALGVRINGYKLRDTVNDDGTFTPYSGTKDMPLTGWARRPTIVITQPDPLPMTITGINLEVDT